MNQTQKRLSIINLAISIGDTETIQLQILKLSPLKSDERIQEIIQELQAENYAKAQLLITEYNIAPTDKIHQRTYLKTESSEEDVLQEALDICKINSESSNEASFSLSENDLPEKSSTATKEILDFDTLLQIESNDVLPNAPKRKVSIEDNDFFDMSNEKALSESNSATGKDDFFDTMSNTTKISEEESSQERSSPFTHEKAVSQTDVIEESSSEMSNNQDGDNILYEPIPNILQKLTNMREQYPTKVSPEVNYPSVDAWLMQISREGYSETDIEHMIEKIRELTKKEAYGEAAQLLLVSAATESLYAQFMLARSLFKGDLFEQNLSEAFSIIYKLAMEYDYAEAICDLAQLYEHGIGVAKDEQRAEALYKEAVELGIKRAKPHYERLNKQKSGIFSYLKK